jgi:5-deoxy-glucuronate isomerase
MISPHHLKSNRAARLRVSVTPATAGWKYLAFKMLALKSGERHVEASGANEVALVPLAGHGRASVSGEAYELKRAGVFVEKPHVLYAPPGKDIEIEAVGDFEFAVGGAPATGKYPVRLFKPGEMKSELRGGGAAQRQVNHVLQHPLPAERLIVFEVYVPGGMWHGWPPHCHDATLGSPYLEETYYYRIEPASGFALHRNYTPESEFDEPFVVRDGDVILVTRGFHPGAAAPGSNVYFLNYLAGDLLDGARATPPVDDPAYAWMKQDWGGQALKLPMGD